MGAPRVWLPAAATLERGWHLCFAIRQKKTLGTEERSSKHRSPTRPRELGFHRDHKKPPLPGRREVRSQALQMGKDHVVKKRRHGFSINFLGTE